MVGVKHGGQVQAVDPLGAYDTPKALADAVVARIADVLGMDVNPSAWRVWEPSAGGGAFVQALLDRYLSGDHPAAMPGIEVYDLDPFAPALHRFAGVTDKYGGQVCVTPQPDPVLLEDGTACRIQAGAVIAEPTTPPDVVIMNPPYAIAVPGRRVPVPVAHLHIRAALRQTRRHVFALVRQSWLGPDRHRDPLDSGQLRAVWTIRPRPKFEWGGRTKGTDSGPSALLWFDTEHEPERYADGSPVAAYGFLDWKGKA